MKKRPALAAAAVAALALCLGCASAPRTIPADLAVSELVQRAQEATDNYNDAAAVAYYRAAMDRFGATDEGVLCMGEYEIGLILYKQGRYAEAHELFSSLLRRYAADSAGLLPRRYFILAQKIMPELEAKLAKAKK